MHQQIAGGKTETDAVTNSVHLFQAHSFAGLRSCWKKTSLAWNIFDTWLLWATVSTLILSLVASKDPQLI